MPVKLELHSSQAHHACVLDDGMRDFPTPSLNSQAHQSSNTFEGIEAASAGQIGTSQLPGSPSVPDDGMRDFVAPS